MQQSRQQFFYALAGGILGFAGALLWADKSRRRDLSEMLKDIKLSGQGHWQNVKEDLRDGAHEIATAAKSAGAAAINTGAEVKYEGKELAYEIRNKAKRKLHQTS